MHPAKFCSVRVCPTQFFKVGTGQLVLIGLSLLLASPTWAQYTPPQDERPPDNTTTTGHRGGCSGDETVTLTALAPQGHVGQTQSTHPTVSWFVPNSEPRPIEFYLYEYGTGNNSRLVYSTVLESQSGMMSLSLPADQPGLRPGQTYNWIVALLCNPNHPSSAIVTSAFLKVADAAPTPNPALTGTADPLAQARLYAEAGLWYDAISTAININTSAAQELQRALLNDLIQAEAATNREHSDRLRQVVDAQQRSQ
ncbi:MAG: DUF928 domain-containing protein [Elainella sp. C42_A2020_010]|nr:DUF928 domain-containing protein [Elainella sp. C42_A2020_010]RNJ68700.1 MAG: DUF928 domain-containing protein [Leptolyngbya sp. IPPAS B-1204]